MHEDCALAAPSTESHLGAITGRIERLINQAESVVVDLCRMNEEYDAVTSRVITGPKGQPEAPIDTPLDRQRAPGNELRADPNNSLAILNASITRAEETMAAIQRTLERLGSTLEPFTHL